MTTTEQRLREAFAEGARAVRPETVRPLSLPRRRRRLPWLVPAISAAAVALSVALSVLVGLRTPTDPAAAGGGPAFVVGVTGFGEFPKGASRVEVRDARTGRLYDTKAASHGLTFQYVAATQDNRTFFVMEVPIRQTACNAIRIYRMKVADTGEIIAFAPLGTRLQGGTMRQETMPGGLAASPDGRKLAYAVLPCGVAAGRLFYKIGVVDLETGTQREWTDPKESVISSLSWTADDRSVAFLRREPTHTPDDFNHPLTKNGVVRLLDTESNASSDLLESKVLVRQSEELTNLWAAVISGDGNTINVVGEYTPLNGALTICEIAVADGRVLRTPHYDSSPGDPTPPIPNTINDIVLRSDPTGRHLLYYDATSSEAPAFGRIDDGRFRTLSGHKDADDDPFSPDDLAW